VLRTIGISSEQGTDTAWTFEPRGPAYGEHVLRKAGWDGTASVLGICPVNPFWWPVRPSVARFVMNTMTGAYAGSHYRSIYFHKSGPGVTRAYNRYLTAIANAVDAFRKDRGVFVILIAMEKLDVDACRKLSAQLGGVPIFSSAQYDMYELVSVLCGCNLIVSSRYHAIVSSMPAGIPSAGVSMDERIRNLMQERGDECLLLEVEDPDLEERLLSVLYLLEKEREAIHKRLRYTVANNLERMARMGVRFEQYLKACYPEFPIRTTQCSWEDYLPPLSPQLHSLLETA